MSSANAVVGVMTTILIAVTTAKADRICFFICSSFVQAIHLEGIRCPCNTYWLV